MPTHLPLNVYISLDGNLFFFITRWENKVFTLRPLKYDLEESYEMLFELSEDESSAAKSKIRKKIN